MTKSTSLHFATLISCLTLGLALNGCATRSATSSVPLTDWPAITSAIPRNTQIEAEVARILAGMTLPQKIGQMTQPEIKNVTPAQVTEYYIGSVLNGGGSWPQGNRLARITDWVSLADQYYNASMATDMKVKVPLIWGADAIHGHGNAHGATLFPHNIGLGAAHDPELIQNIGVAVGRQVRATGINWVFGPTLAVARDDRWGRTYESFSEDATLVNAYAGAYVTGMQGSFSHDGNVVATAKHFIGDGGTDRGQDQGVATVSKAEMINVHAQGYYGALAAGAQTVMASFNSWNDVAAGVDYGKLHGSKALLTQVLKQKMGFDGFVVSDWNGIAQVPGCTQASCAQAINAGIDMVMVPDNWRAFIANTMEQVNRGEIPMARIDDAVSRILRVKLRAGMFGKKPSQGIYAGKPEALLARDLARQAVRESLVLLKNNHAILPLARGQHILVVGKSADSLQNQTGGWTLGWQGTGNANTDFPNADSLLDGIRAAVGSANVAFSETAEGMDVSRFDAVIAIIGETPYAEGNGDIAVSDTLRHSRRYPEDLAVLKAVAGKGVPVVTVLVTGRPVYANDLLNLSNALVVAWLPGTEGKGVADVLIRNSAGGIHHDFTGRLSFSWPKSACQTPLNFGDTGYAPLFAPGYGLNYQRTVTVGALDGTAAPGGCGHEDGVPIFNRSDRAPYALHVASAANNWVKVPVGADLNAALNLPLSQPSIRVETTQINTQQDAKLVTWHGGPARFLSYAPQTASLRTYAANQGVLQFDMAMMQEPQGSVTLAIECGESCRGEVDITALLKKFAPLTKHTVKVPLLCFEAKGTNFDNVDVPFSVLTSQSFSAAFANIQIVSGAAKDADTLTCSDVGGEFQIGEQHK
ncbi:glycoside hydrolase family 3 N-terminal domain-containing protein [Rhodoferax ferrireducens]|uniref:glycoside hydrolase family 3 protein n=1 Tax=Rhodoferax ferrireducens TaxID=192843 RepID=UPI00298DB600|nr:glycoside hydrolase family 3 N-terminal domain-containing protein [Rhodoferax ferrireducens]WPC68062.1 glycoside hydrolase family 3 N-terminal domain-containing protein [Rhodoferax ferrireducens]